MDVKTLMEMVLRSEGYSQGFKEGFAACAKMVAEDEMKKQSEQKSTEGENNAH